MSGFIERLEAAVANEWENIKEGRFWRRVMAEPVSVELYQSMLEQVYHYTRHNSINQAAAAYKTAPERRRLLRFVYNHAREELGHEGMVINDLKSINRYDEGFEQRQPLASTQALIAFLYQVALEHGAVARLGYSYWAETCYGHIDPLLGKFRQDLGLADRNLTFFVAHSEIDSKHAEEVNEAIRDCEPSPAEQDAILNVAVTTLYLTGQMLDQVEREFRLKATPVVRAAA